MKRSIRSLFFLLLIANSLWCQSAVERQLSSRVSRARLLATVRELVRAEPRTGGTKSGDRAAQYVAKKFRQAGLKPEVVQDPELLVFTNLKWSLEVEEPESLKTLIRNAWLAGYSPSAPKTSAQLVYLANRQRLEMGDLDGKAVLVDDDPGRQSYQRLVEAGARCILLTSPKLPGAYSKWAMITELAASQSHQIPLFNLSWNNGHRLKKALADSQKVVVSFFCQTLIAQGRPKTVTATLRGQTKDYYIVCAHGDSDSGGPGADDNASGVSGVLELARVLNSLVQANVLPRPQKAIRFIVWGREMYSTQHYVKTHADELERIAGVLNFDEIGTGASRDCLYFESNDVKQNQEMLRALQGVAEDYVGKRGYWSEATTNPSQGGTDSYVFFPHSLRELKVPEVRIPSVTVYTAAWNELKGMKQTEGWTSKAWKGPPDSVYIDYSAYYHSSLDIPQMTTEQEPYDMVWAVKAVGIALMRLAW
jgi:hypothetical protein